MRFIYRYLLALALLVTGLSAQSLSSGTKGGAGTLPNITTQGTFGAGNQALRIVRDEKGRVGEVTPITLLDIPAQFSTAEVLSLSAPEANRLRNTGVTDAINPGFGVLVPATWDGNAITGKWRHTYTGLEITKDYLTLFRSAAKARLKLDTPKLVTRPFMPEDMIQLHVNWNSATSGIAANGGKSYYEYYTLANASGASKPGNILQMRVPPLNSIACAYYRIELSVYGAQSDGTNTYLLTCGFNTATGTGASAVTDYQPNANDSICWMYDPSNALGRNSGNSQNMIAGSRAAGTWNSQLTPYTIPFSTGDPSMEVLEIFATETEVQFYYGERLIWVTTTQIPTTVTLTTSLGILKLAGTSDRRFRTRGYFTGWARL